MSDHQLTTKSLKLRGSFLIILTALCYLFCFLFFNLKRNTLLALSYFIYQVSLGERGPMSNLSLVLIICFPPKSDRCLLFKPSKSCFKSISHFFFIKLLLNIKLSPETIGNMQQDRQPELFLVEEVTLNAILL